MVVHSQWQMLLSSLQIEDTEVQFQVLTAINKRVNKYESENMTFYKNDYVE